MQTETERRRHRFDFACPQHGRSEPNDYTTSRGDSGILFTCPECTWWSVVFPDNM